MSSKSYTICFQIWCSQAKKPTCSILTWI